MTWDRGDASPLSSPPLLFSRSLILVLEKRKKTEKTVDRNEGKAVFTDRCRGKGKKESLSKAIGLGEAKATRAAYAVLSFAGVIKQNLGLFRASLATTTLRFCHQNDIQLHDSLRTSQRLVWF